MGAGVAELPVNAGQGWFSGCGAALWAAGCIVERELGGGRAVVGVPAAAAAFVSRGEKQHGPASLGETHVKWKHCAASASF